MTGNIDPSIISEVEVDIDNLLEWVNRYYAPEDVFTERDLYEWAKENGYVKKE